MKLAASFCILILVFLVPYSCSKTGGTLPPPPPDPCSIISIELSGTVSNPSTTGAADGSITVSATGSTGFTYNINGGAFQATGLFKNLAAGNYTVTAKNIDGCTSSLSFIVINPSNLCAGVNISLTAGATGNVPCEANTASITVTAVGGQAPYTFSINGGPFQSANIFTDLASGSYTITAKDANGCTGSGSKTVNSLPAGPLFAQVRSIVRAYCLGCHGPSVSNGGVSYAEDCNIVANKIRIKARAVDGIPSPMPQGGLLSSYIRQGIVNWINAGGRFTD